MKKSSMKKLLSVFLCIVLIAAMVLFATGCKGNQPTEEPQSSSQSTETTGSDPTQSTGDTQSQQKDNVRGTGATTFFFKVKDGTNEAEFEIHTDKKTVGEALLELELIAGENGPYGLYVDSVNGITADWDTEKAYWSLSINGEYAVTGVDMTDIVPGTTYTLEKVYTE